MGARGDPVRGSRCPAGTDAGRPRRPAAKIAGHGVPTKVKPPKE